MTLLLSQAGYGRRLGVTAAAISQWKKAGMLVMRGAQIDVEASDERLKRCRTKGLPPLQLESKTVKRGLLSANTGAQLNVESEPVCLSCAELLRRLDAFDWTQTFDWNDTAQHERATLAAQCVGWYAVTSDLYDSGHWSGYQLRRTDTDADLDMDDIAGGYGFELDAWTYWRAAALNLNR